MTDLSSLVPTAQHFYRSLSENNTRDWWQDNRTTYDTILKPGAEALLAQLTEPLSTLAEAPITTKLFRPHRDTRFSKDKSPYNTHLHLMWQIAGDGVQSPVFFFGIGQDYVTAGAGIMGLDKAMLVNWRSFIDLDTARVTGIIDDVTTQGYTLRPPDLKRVPPAYDKDHQAERLLRMKSVVASAELSPATTDVSQALLKAYTDLWPINALLVQISES